MSTASPCLCESGRVKPFVQGGTHTQTHTHTRTIAETLAMCSFGLVAHSPRTLCSYFYRFGLVSTRFLRVSSIHLTTIQTFLPTLIAGPV